LKIPGNEPRALVEAEISPGPLKKHREGIAETDQKYDVDK
jgi:hypothetical protein